MCVKSLIKYDAMNNRKISNISYYVHNEFPQL